MKKWSDQSWQFVVHVSMTVFELWLFATTEDGLLQNMATAFYPKPTMYKPSDRMVVFYMTQIVRLYSVTHVFPARTWFHCFLTFTPPQQAIWIYTCFIHRFTAERIKDYVLMCVDCFCVAGRPQLCINR